MEKILPKVKIYHMACILSNWKKTLSFCKQPTLMEISKTK